MLLVGEHISLIVWGALVVIVVGLLLVEPKKEVEPEPHFLDETV
jgi:hypothetical protein